MRQQVNLYQPIFRKQEKKFSAKAMLQAMAAIFVGIVLLFAWTQWQVSLLRNQSARADQQLAVVSKRLGEVTQQFGGQVVVHRSADEEIAHLEQRLASFQRIQDVLSRGLFSNTRGFSEYFIAFARQHSAGAVALTGFEIVGAAEKVTLQGRAVSPEAVPRYMQQLSIERPLAGVEFQVFQLARAGSGNNIDFTLKTAGATPAAGKTP